MGIDAGTIDAALTLDLSPFARGIRQAVGHLDVFNDASATAEQKLIGLGNALEGVGSTLTRAVSLPLVGVGAAALKVSSDFEAGMSKVEAIASASAEDMALLEAKAKEMGATTKFSATESAEAFNYMAMAGWKTADMLGGIEGVMNLAAASGEDLALVSDIVTDALTAFGLSAADSGHFADVLAAASSNANTNVSMMGYTFKYAAPLAGALGYSIEDTALAIGLMANAGIKGEQAGTNLRSTFANLTGEIELTGEKLGTYVLNMENADGSMVPLRTTIDRLREAFAQMTEAEQIANAEALVGKEAMSGLLAIVNASETDYNKLSQAIANADGEAERMAETMQDNLQGSLVILKSALEGAGIAVGEVLVPSITSGVRSVTDLVSKFNELSPETQKLIVDIGLFVAAVGPAMTIGGRLIKGAGTLITTFKGGIETITMLTGAIRGTMSLTGGWATALNVARTAVSALSGPVGLAVAGVAGLTTAGVALYKHLNEEAIPAIDLFADKVTMQTTVLANGEMAMEQYTTTISDATKKAVQAYLDLDAEATASLTDFYTSSEMMTEDYKNQLTGKYQIMAAEIISALNDQQAQEMAVMQDFFAQSQALSEQEEADILSRTQAAYAGKRQTIDDMQNQILAILQNAADESRGITEQEAQSILDIQRQMKEQAIGIMSEQEVEANVILERMKEHEGRITAEMASEKIKLLEEQKQEAINKANEEYDETVRILTRQKDELKTISQEQYDALLADAQAQRDGIVEQAELTKGQTVAKMVELQSGLTAQIDLTTGDILTRWQAMTGKHKQDNEQYLAEIKEQMAAGGANAIDALNQSLSAGEEKVSATGKSVAQALVNRFNQTLQIQSPSRVFMQMGDYIVQGLAEGIAGSGEVATQEIENLAQLITSSGNAISTGLISVDERTGQAMIDTTYKAVMYRVDAYMDERDQRVALMTEGTDENIDQIQREVDATRDAYSIKMQLYQQEYLAQTALVDEQASAELKALQAQIDAINDLNEQDRRKEAAERYEKQLAEKEAKLATVASEEEAQKVLEEINALQLSRDKELLQQQRKDEQDSLREQMDAVREQASARKAILQEELEAKQYQLQQQREAELKHLEAMMKALKQDQKDRLELEKVQTELKEKQYNLDTKNYKGEQKTQTENRIQELKKREQELIKSINNNQQTLQNFTPVMQKIANDYGEALLSGFKSTEDEIRNYFDSLRRYAEDATSGAYSNFIDDSVSYVSYNNNDGYQSYAYAAMPAAMPMQARAVRSKAQVAANYARTEQATKQFGIYSSSANKTQKLEIDYDKLAKAITKSVQPSVTISETFNSPKALSEREIRQQNLQLERRLVFDLSR